MFNYSAYHPEIQNIILTGRSLLLPREKKLVSQFAAENRYVSSEESARPGMWDNNITPFAIEIMDAFNDPLVEKITMMASSQVVKTEIIKNIIAWIVVNDPAPILVIYPTDGDARDFSVEKLEPMIKYNKFLRDRFSPAKSNSTENKTLFKKFKGGFLAIAGGRVPQDLARRSVKYVIVDDRDRVGVAGLEGDAVALAWQRTESYTFLGRKLIEVSSPTIDGRSPIQKSYLAGDQRENYLPCPYCSHYQTFTFDNLIWDKEKDMFGKTIKHYPETTKYQCINPECNQPVEEHHKMWMLLSGKWIAKYPERVNHRSYHLNRLYSTFSSWVDLAKEFISKKNDPLLLQVFFNTALGKTWKLQKTEDIDELGLMKQIENYLTPENPNIPNEVVYLTAAIDTQGDRFEISIEGWGVDEENWLIDYKKILGDPDDKSTRDQLDEYIYNYKVKRNDGVELSLGGYKDGRRYYAVLIDSGGTRKNKRTATQVVYDYCRQRQYMGIIPIKGVGGKGFPAILNTTFVGKYRDVKLQRLGVDAIKDVIWKRLVKSVSKDGKIIPGPQKQHFTIACTDGDYFSGLLSERYFEDAGRKIGKWDVIAQGVRNEPWDLKIYNYASLKLSNVNLEQLREHYLKKQEIKQPDQTLIKNPGARQMKITKVIR